MADLLGIFAVAIVFRSVYHIAARSFYARQDTKTPLYVSIFAISLNIALAIWFTMKLDFGVHGIAWAGAIVSAVEMFVLFFIMARQIPDLFDKVLIHAVARMASATGFMAVITYISVRTLPLASGDRNLAPTLLKFGVITLISFAVYLFFCWVFRLKEVDPVFRKARKILFNQAG